VPPNGSQAAAFGSGFPADDPTTETRRAKHLSLDSMCAASTSEYLSFKAVRGAFRSSHLSSCPTHFSSCSVHVVSISVCDSPSSGHVVSTQVCGTRFSGHVVSLAVDVSSFLVCAREFEKFKTMKLKKTKLKCRYFE
jgi:hypothetical protein